MILKEEILEKSYFTIVHLFTVTFAKSLDGIGALVYFVT